MDQTTLQGLRITKPRLELLETLNIKTVEDLITYYPYRYEFLMDHSPGVDDMTIVKEGMIVRDARLAYRRGKQSKMIFDWKCDGIVYSVAIFNRHFMKAKLCLGQVVVVTGKMAGPTSITAMDVKIGGFNEHAAITPVYSLCEGITSKSIQGYVRKAMDKYQDEIHDFVPLAYKEKYRLIDRVQALNQIHFPNTTDEIKHALRHLKYEEFLRYSILMAYRHQLGKMSEDSYHKAFDEKKVMAFIDHLPFQLTDDQMTCVKEILHDLKDDQPMNRLLQGDVGSGKTIVSVIAMYATSLADYQSAIMAPTEILAKQHYRNLIKYYEGYDVKVALLIGSQTAKEKAAIVEALAHHDIDVVVGTHALIQDSVAFARLGLVVADEQHRFGVNQRHALKNKGQRVDLLSMSATPIPRTLAISLFGDMDVSTVKTMPAGRKEVITKFYAGHSMKPILPFLKQYLATGQQCYVVCPLVEQSDGLDARDAIQIYEAMGSYFKGQYQVGLLHGKMNDDEKEAIMQQFMENKIQILVSTTVIEVGVDVANANMMVIYSADRFGISQLHQLRGRVGRGKDQGYCFLLSDSDKEETLQRIQFLEKSSDGFEISQFDLKLRGPGEVLGQRQSGIPTFKIADLYEDFAIMNHAHEDALEIVAHLGNYPNILEFLKLHAQ